MSGLRQARVLALCGVAALIFAPLAHARAFPSPDAAIDALVAAVRADNPRAIEGVLGTDSGALVESGDAVSDKADRAAFVKLYDAKHEIERNGAAVTLVVGSDNRPFPIPLHEVKGRWLFDLSVAREGILNRRVGRNELNAIEVCRAIVEAERDYASGNRNGVAEYAAKFMSDPGKRNGLYWPTDAGEPQSPLGPLVATARAQGYNGHHEPYHGYFYKILLRQGPHAPGGSRDYVVKGHMIGGFAIVAWPAKWGDSGVMTFLVDQGGVVMQRNLGPNSARVAAAMTRYDPDAGWKPAEAAPAK
ncbi:MAG TPA: DUF2950 domain-containing protein [Stellaceae bacterium]|nr:DUF2950 domain-containing protein [Stellaceae bacterium]